MNKEEQFLLNKIIDMASRVYMSDRPEFTGFLNLNEQDLFLSNTHKLPPVNYELVGGHIFSERNIIALLPQDNLYEVKPPIVAVKCVPQSIKYSDELTHRDYLGALMHLGVNRNTIGDILFDGKTSYVVCLDNMSEYLCENLIKVKHTIINTTIIDISEIPECKSNAAEISGFVSSNRIDAIISVAFNLSRSTAAKEVSEGRVYVNSRLINSASMSLKNKDIVSVRGTGRFVFNDVVATTKKNRLMISITKYI